MSTEPTNRELAEVARKAAEMTEPSSVVYWAIASGAVDVHLDDLATAIRQRKEVIAKTFLQVADDLEAAP